MWSGSVTFAALLRWTSGSMDILAGRSVIISMTNLKFVYYFTFLKTDLRFFGWRVIAHHFSQVAPEAEQAPKTNQYTQAEHGKTEMSLLHFTLTNPGWKPTGENERYLAGVKEAKGRDLAEIQLQVKY